LSRHQGLNFEETIDYSLHHRTKHPEIDAPCDALKKFNLPSTFKPATYIQDLLPKMEQSLKTPTPPLDQKSQKLIKDDDQFIQDDDDEG
jgi:hypothetical protein